MATTEWLPEIHCPPEDAPVSEETDKALRQYIRKLETELLVAPKKAMIDQRDELILFHIEKHKEMVRKIEMLRARIPDMDAMFVVPKDEWKNRIITTLGFAEKEFYMQFSSERRLVRLVTDTDLNNEQMPPV